MDRTDRSGPDPRRRPQRSAARGTWRWPENSLLGGLPEEVRERFLSLGIMVQRPPGTVLIREEASRPPSWSCWKAAWSRSPVVRRTRGRRRSWPSASAAISSANSARWTASRARRPSPRAARWSAPGGPVDFLAALNADADLSQAVSRSVVDKLRVANSRRIDFAGSNAPTRLARVIYDLAMTYGEPDRRVHRDPLAAHPAGDRLARRGRRTDRLQSPETTPRGRHCQQRLSSDRRSGYREAPRRGVSVKTPLLDIPGIPVNARPGSGRPSPSEVPWNPGGIPGEP